MTDGHDELVYDLSSSPSHLLHRAQQFAADRFSDELDSRKITQRQFAVLSAVAAQEGLTQTDLVRATGIDRSTLAELVARMARRALLRRERAKADARANVVRLTDEGRALLAWAMPHVASADAAILAAMPKNKRTAFVDTLQRIARSLDEPDAAETAAPEPAPKKAKKDKPAAKDKADKAKGAKKGKGAKAKSSAKPKKAKGAKKSAP